MGMGMGSRWHGTDRQTSPSRWARDETRGRGEDERGQGGRDAVQGREQLHGAQTWPGARRKRAAFSGNADVVREYLRLDKVKDAVEAFKARPDAAGAAALLRHFSNSDDHAALVHDAEMVLAIAAEHGTVDLLLAKKFVNSTLRMSAPETALSFWNVISTHPKVRNKFRIDAPLATGLLNAAMECGNKDVVVPICRRLVNEHTTLDSRLMVYVLNALLMAGEHARMPQMMQVFQKQSARNVDIVPDKIVFNCIFRCCAAIGDVSLLQQWIASFADCGHTVGAKDVIVIMDAYCGCGDGAAAVELLAKFRGRGSVMHAHVERLLKSALDRQDISTAALAHKRFVNGSMQDKPGVQQQVARLCAAQGDWGKALTLLSRSRPAPGAHQDPKGMESYIASVLDVISFVKTVPLDEFSRIVDCVAIEDPWPPEVAAALVRLLLDQEGALPATEAKSLDARAFFYRVGVPFLPVFTNALVESLVALGRHKEALHVHETLPHDSSRTPHAIDAAVGLGDIRAVDMLEQLLEKGADVPQRRINDVVGLLVAQDFFDDARTLVQRFPGCQQEYPWLA